MNLSINYYMLIKLSATILDRYLKNDVINLSNKINIKNVISLE